MRHSVCKGNTHTINRQPPENPHVHMVKASHPLPCPLLCSGWSVYAHGARLCNVDLCGPRAVEVPGTTLALSLTDAQPVSSDQTKPRSNKSRLQIVLGYPQQMAMDSPLLNTPFIVVPISPKQTMFRLLLLSWGTHPTLPPAQN